MHRNGLTGPVVWDVTADVQAGVMAWLIKKRNEDQNGRVEYYSREGSLATFGDLRAAPQLMLE